MSYSCDPEWLLWNHIKGLSEKMLLQKKLFMAHGNIKSSYWSREKTISEKILTSWWTFILYQSAQIKESRFIFFLNLWNSRKLSDWEVWVCCYREKVVFCLGPHRHTYNPRGWKCLTMLLLNSKCHRFHRTRQITGPSIFLQNQNRKQHIWGSFVHQRIFIASNRNYHWFDHLHCKFLRCKTGNFHLHK